MSRGVGKAIKDLLVFICQTIDLVHNTLWSFILCPLLRITMIMAEFTINVVDMLLDVRTWRGCARQLHQCLP